MPPYHHLLKCVMTIYPAVHDWCMQASFRFNFGAVVYVKRDIQNWVKVTKTYRNQPFIMSQCKIQANLDKLHQLNR